MADSQHAGQPETLDPAVVAQTVPPASMRYYGWLYAPPAKRDVLVALHLLSDELATTARGSHHDVAHTRLKWWTEEIDRLAAGRPAHPATRVLAQAFGDLGRETARLRGVIEAAAMDLALITYSDAAELDIYLERSGGITVEFAARWLLAPALPSTPILAAARRLGALLRRVETLRDMRVDAAAGRLYFSLQQLDAAGIDVADLRAPAFTVRTQEFLQAAGREVATQLAAAVNALSPEARGALRPLLVAAALHQRLLEHVIRGFAANAPQRAELRPFEKTWLAWRAARRAR